MATYKGVRHSACGAQLVTKDDNILSPKPSQEIYNHSPDGFNFSYGGSGPAQLALALLYDVTRDKEIALAHHQDFKWAFVARWGDDWAITTQEILDWLATRKEECQIW
jgi:hypothetical protein